MGFSLPGSQSKAESRKSSYKVNKLLSSWAVMISIGFLREQNVNKRQKGRQTWSIPEQIKHIMRFVFPRNNMDQMILEIKTNGPLSTLSKNSWNLPICLLFVDILLQFDKFYKFCLSKPVHETSKEVNETLMKIIFLDMDRAGGIANWAILMPVPSWKQHKHEKTVMSSFGLRRGLNFHDFLSKRGWG